MSEGYVHLRCAVKRSSRGEALQEYPARLGCKDGTIREVRITASVNFDGIEFVNTRCLTRDVTDEMRADRAIRLSAERYATLAERGRDSYLPGA